MYFLRASEPTRSYVGQLEHRNGRESSRKSSFPRLLKTSSTRTTRLARKSRTRTQANVFEESRSGARLKRNLEGSRFVLWFVGRRNSLSTNSPSKREPADVGEPRDSASDTRLVDRAVALQLQRFRDSCDALPRRVAETVGNHEGADRPRR